MAPAAIATAAQEENENKNEEVRCSKVCLSVYCEPMSYDSNFFDGQHIYLLDLNQKGDDAVDGDFIPAAPLFRLASSVYTAACVLKSTLYVFACASINGDRSGKKKSVYTFDLLSPPPTAAPDSILTLDSLGKAPCMHGLKLAPMAIPTPDNRKMLVFSGSIILGRDPDDGYVDFELFDSRSETWEILPSFPDMRMSESTQEYEYYYDDDEYPLRWSVSSYGFLDKSTFYIAAVDFYNENSSDLVFTLDVESPSDGWVQRSEPFFFPKRGKFQRIGGRGRLCLAARGAYDYGRGRYFYFPPSPGARKNRDDRRKLAVTLLDRGGDNNNIDDADEEKMHTLCFLQSDFDDNCYPPADPLDPVPLHPRVFIDVHKFNLASCFGSGERREFTPLETASSKFLLNAVGYASFWPYLMYPVYE